MTGDDQLSDKRSVTRLVVFSDDWGRHPSSCQHLIGHLLDRYPTLWINTIGMRTPKLSWEDAGKVSTKLRQWFTRPTVNTQMPDRLAVLNPLMYPGFRRRWQRRLNAKLLSQAVDEGLGARVEGELRIAVTTVPMTADLVDRLDVDRWVYYCVDDFSVWPGLDCDVLNVMDHELVRRVDAVICVSETLQQRVVQMGRQSHLLTHGIDLEHWQKADRSVEHVSQCLPDGWSQWTKPIALFWGAVDRRLDRDWCQGLAKHCGTLVLAGPQQSPDPKLRTTNRLVMTGPVPYVDLPVLAQIADVLVMPYADLPVTRAIQPLKFKEYLATGKPAVVRKLPGTVAWQDAADVVDSLEQFVQLVAVRAGTGTPPSQRNARARLNAESWASKSTDFEHVLLGHDVGA